MDLARYREAEQRLWAENGAVPTERFVRLPRNGLRVRVLEVGDGDGPPVLFVHGSPSAASTWAPRVWPAPIPGTPGGRYLVLRMASRHQPAPTPGGTSNSQMTPTHSTDRIDAERFRALARSLAEIVWVTAADGRVEDVPEWRAYTGQSPEEVRGWGWLEAVHPEDRARARAAWEGAVAAAGATPYAVEYRIRGIDGSYRWFQARGAPVLDERGAIREWVGGCVDVSDRKQVEEALRGSERHLRAVIDSMFAFVGVTTPDGVLIEANRAALEAADLDPEDVLGLPFEEAYWWCYDPEIQRRLREAIERAAQGEPSRYDVVVRLGPDRFEPIDFIIAPLRDEEGRVTHLVPSAMVITERVRAEEAVRDSEARFRALADNIPQLAWMMDADGWIFWYNRRWFEYTGTTLDEMEGWGWRKLHHPDHLDRVVEGLGRALESGDPWEDTFPLRGRDGEYRWFLSRAHAIRDEDGDVSLWFGTNTDITEDRQAAAERERLLEEVEAASDAKSDFMAVMSHELRTPLNAIIGYTELLDMGLPSELPDDARLAIRRVRLAASHQRQLIDDILTFSRLAAGQEVVEVEPVPLDALLDEIDAVIAPLAAGKGLELVIEANATREITTDPRKLRQILVNLLGNAVKFTESGRVELRVEEEEPDRLRLVVEDTGIGISTDGLGRAFDPFWQADHGLTRTAGGSGLGLAISQRYARLLGGDISAESEPGHGSRFTLSLPRTPRPS
jgi:PAS domain S-box-containing protein